MQEDWLYVIAFLRFQDTDRNTGNAALLQVSQY